MIAKSTTKSIPRLVELVRPVTCKNGSQGEFKRDLMENFCMKHKLLSLPSTIPRNVAHVGGERAYILLGSLAKLERALTRWSMKQLISKHKFTPVIVPNIIYDDIIDKCGFPTKSGRTQVYKISSNNQESILNHVRDETRTQSCLAGTSEFALASIHIGDTIPSQDLPKRYCALSRCYRAESSKTSAEWGLYRVHYFNKVEMFGFSLPEDSSRMHQDFLEIQKDLFGQLGLQFQVLDMPEDDLGLSAKKKYDIEAWMAGRKKYGEISSTSNCEDYQSSRLNIKYSRMVECDDQLQMEERFVHTVNGTACSTIRTMIAIIEQHQAENGEQVSIPEPLIPYMGGVKIIPTENDKRLMSEIDLYPSKFD